MSARRQITTKDVCQIRELRYGDGLTLKEVARRIGCSWATVWKYAPGRPGMVDNAALREAFLASGLSAAHVARYLGWWAGRWADSSRVRRVLGITPQTSGQGRKSYSRLIDAELAERIAEAINVSPWSVIEEKDWAA